MHNPIFQQHFQSVFNQIASFFPSGLPEMTPADWEELQALEDRINELWLAEEGTFNEFKEVCGRYKMFWFRKKDCRI